MAAALHMKYPLEPDANEMRRLIEADLKKAVSLGATVTQEKMEIPNVGWFGVFRDLTGNSIALYTSMNPDFNKP